MLSTLLNRVIKNHIKKWQKILNMGYNKLNHKIPSIMDLGLALTNNEVERIMKLIKSLENK